MAISIGVIEILNNAYQLSALPIGESLTVRLSAMPDMSTIDKYVSIVNIDSSQDIPNLTSIPFSINEEHEYKRIECNYSIEEYLNPPDDETYILTVSPKELLKPQSQYYLFVHKNLAPLSYVITKTVSTGPSSISVVANDTGTGINELFSIQITSQSNLANSQHIIGFDLYDHNGLQESVTKNLRESNTLELTDAHTVFFNTEIPYLVGETFEIQTIAFERISEVKAQFFKTIIESSVIENPDIISHRIDQDDILNFYATTAWNTVNNPVVQPTPSNGVVISSRFIYPNKARIEFDKEVLISSIVPSSFVVDISYAFNNYMLPQMGLYSESTKYIIACTIVPKTITTTQRIDIVISKDTDGLVPPQDKFIVTVA